MSKHVYLSIFFAQLTSTLPVGSVPRPLPLLNHLTWSVLLPVSIETLDGTHCGLFA